MNNIKFNSTSYNKEGYMIQTIIYYQNELSKVFEDQIIDEIENQDALVKVQNLGFVLEVKEHRISGISQSQKQFIITYNCTNECIPLLEYCNQIDYTEKINICNQLIDISEQMNKRQIFHNNLKPSNVFYYKGYVLLSEFGSIRTFQENLCFDFANAYQKQKQKEFKYFCPESLLKIIKDNDDIDFRRDALIEYYENLDINKLIEIDEWAIGVLILDIFNPPNLKRENSEKLKKTIDLISQNIQDTLLNKIKQLLKLELEIKYFKLETPSAHFSTIKNYTRNKLNLIEYYKKSYNFAKQQYIESPPSLIIRNEEIVKQSQNSNKNDSVISRRPLIQIPSNEENKIAKCEKFIKTSEAQYLIQDYEEFMLLPLECQNKYMDKLKQVIVEDQDKETFEKALFHTQEKMHQEEMKYQRNFVNIKPRTDKNVKTFFSQFLQPCMKFNKKFDIYYRKIDPQEMDLTISMNNKQLTVKYRGQLINDIPNGFGFNFFSQTNMQLGIFRNGQLLKGWSIEECSYLKFIKYIHFYKGEFYKSQKNGKGKLKIYQILNINQKILFLLIEMIKTQKGTYGEGYFQNGQLTGSGLRIKYNQNGRHQHYQGKFQNGKINGKGRYKEEGQEWQEGNFVNDKFSRI